MEAEQVGRSGTLTTGRFNSFSPSLYTYTHNEDVQAKYQASTSAYEPCARHIQAGVVQGQSDIHYWRLVPSPPGFILLIQGRSGICYTITETLMRLGADAVIIGRE